MKLLLLLVTTGIVGAAVFHYPQPKGSKTCNVEGNRLKVGEILKPVKGPNKCTKLTCEEDYNGLMGHLESCGVISLDPAMSPADKAKMIDEFEKSGLDNQPYPLCCRPL